MKKIDNPPFLYLFIYKKFREKFKLGEVIRYKPLLETMHMVIYNLPPIYNNMILKEMVEFGLIERINKQKYKIEEFEYEDVIRELEEIEDKNQKYKILKSDFKKLIERIERISNSNRKYRVLKLNYNKSLKELEEYHYW